MFYLVTPLSCVKGGVSGGCRNCQVGNKVVLLISAVDIPLWLIWFVRWKIQSLYTFLAFQSLINPSIFLSLLCATNPPPPQIIMILSSLSLGSSDVCITMFIVNLLALLQLDYLWGQSGPCNSNLNNIHGCIILLNFFNFSRGVFLWRVKVPSLKIVLHLL